ncbi:hypothetical protein BDW02DRAFT_570765 [Decorospora gaudefroyi]|uniref:Uncharacterized protein n=1 Tax=Decorospora gaudefroyi TaxID=184978 RepID=A0A6A5KCH9_9PLEO|nr:hypothetical protein BDW02DRAFT_570765 [Decorospora gaudefroyi]
MPSVYPSRHASSPGVFAPSPPPARIAKAVSGSRKACPPLVQPDTRAVSMVDLRLNIIERG